MKFVFDFGGVVFNWKPLVLLQQVLPHHAVDEASARDCAAAIFQGFHPTSDWALFDQGGIEPEDLAHRIATRTGLGVTGLAFSAGASISGQLAAEPPLSKSPSNQKEPASV